MISYRFKLVDSLEKIFPAVEPQEKNEGIRLTAFINETVSFQIAYYVNCSGTDLLDERCSFSVAAGANVKVKMRKVDLMPSAFPCNAEHDEDYLTTSPGMFPDLLSPMPDDGIVAVHRQWRAVWVDLKPKSGAGGKQDIFITCRTAAQKDLWGTSLELTVIPQELPKQQLMHTEMLHADCLADYYGVEAFSEKHWSIVENFISGAVKHGINMIFTPLFTPPMDTAAGGERTTAQLVQVTKKDGKYAFDFSDLKRWIAVCDACGAEYIEMAPLFTQWGAKAAPKVMANVDGKQIRLFGWDTDAGGSEYQGFLASFLPELYVFLKKENLLGRTWLHVSDEPQLGDLSHYCAMRDCMQKHLPGLPLFDALSNYEFYKTGKVENPVVSIDHMEPFVEAGARNLWAYYCCAQGVDVSNRFFAMPSYRNRILGVQLYLYELKGFLHWGYNFYNTRYSKEHINPYAVTDCGESFPSGDAFLVYPGKDGKPLSSIRLMVLQQALNDLRALKLLESVATREFVVKMIHETAGMRVTFKQYPRNSRFFHELREKINKQLAQHA